MADAALVKFPLRVDARATISSRRIHSNGPRRSFPFTCSYLDRATPARISADCILRAHPTTTDFVV